MNTYSISSDSPRWWWASASAGIAGAAAVAAIALVPTVVGAAPAPTSPAPPAGQVFIGDAPDHQCFMLRSPWNEELDGMQPRCSSVTRAPAHAGVFRPGLTYTP